MALTQEQIRQYNITQAEQQQQQSFGLTGEAAIANILSSREAQQRRVQPTQQPRQTVTAPAIQRPLPPRRLNLEPGRPAPGATPTGRLAAPAISFGTLDEFGRPQINIRPATPDPEVATRVGQQDVLLSPSQFESIRERFGVTPGTEDIFFERRGTDIFAKRGILDVLSGQTAVPDPETFQVFAKGLGVTSPTIEKKYFERRGEQIFFKPGVFEPLQQKLQDIAIDQGLPPTDIEEAPSDDGFEFKIPDETLSFDQQVNAYVESVRKAYELAQSDLQKQLEARDEALRFELEGLKDELASRPGRLEELRKQYGITDQMQKMQELNSRIAAKVASYDQAFFDISQQTIATPLLRGQQSALQRQQAIDIGAMTGALEAMQGNFNLAKDLIDQSIDVEFTSQEKRFDVIKRLIDDNRASLTKEEAKQANIVLGVMEMQALSLADKRQNKELNRDLMINLAKVGADISDFDINDSYDTNLQKYAKDVQKFKLADAKQPTQFEQQSAGFYDVMSFAEETLTEIGESPYIGTMKMADYTPNPLKNSEQRRFDQATRAFVNAVLRRESGATITDQEYINKFKELMPEPGDDEETLKLKAQARQIQINTMYRNAGNAQTGVPGADTTGTLPKYTAVETDDINVLLDANPGYEEIYEEMSQPIVNDETGETEYPTQQEVIDAMNRIYGGVEIQTPGVTPGETVLETGISEQEATLGPSAKSYISVNALLESEPKYTDLVKQLRTQLYKEKKGILAFNTDKIVELWDREASKSIQKTKDEIDAEILKRIETGAFRSDLSSSLKGSTKGADKLKNGQTTLSSMGSGIVTGINGSSAWSHGLDFVLAGGKGASVPSPLSGKVVYADKRGGFGNQVRIKLDDGNTIWISHLDSMKVKPGQRINKGDIIGTQGNTGTVLGGRGEKLSRQQIASGRGTHLDITIQKPDGSYYKPREVAALLGDTRISNRAIV